MIKKYGPYVPPISRLLSKVLVDANGCWIWQGYTDKDGYGDIGLGITKVKTHRLAYAEIIEEIPEGLELDHLCRNTSCCNPWHLEAVTRTENLRRRPILPRPAFKTHCRLGHLILHSSPKKKVDGTIIRSRYCAICKRAREKVLRAKLTSA